MHRLIVSTLPLPVLAVRQQTLTSPDLASSCLRPTSLPPNTTTPQLLLHSFDPGVGSVFFPSLHSSIGSLPLAPAHRLDSPLALRTQESKEHATFVLASSVPAASLPSAPLPHCDPADPFGLKPLPFSPDRGHEDENASFAGVDLIDQFFLPGSQPLASAAAAAGFANTFSPLMQESKHGTAGPASLVPPASPFNSFLFTPLPHDHHATTQPRSPPLPCFVAALFPCALLWRLKCVEYNGETLFNIPSRARRVIVYSEHGSKCAIASREQTDGKNKNKKCSNAKSERRNIATSQCAPLLLRRCDFVCEHVNRGVTLVPLAGEPRRCRPCSAQVPPPAGQCRQCE